ncbi:MAG: ABC transporter permease [Candidatus Zhuqueibacterota bacterium]
MKHQIPKPPRIGAWLLSLFLNYNHPETLLADFEEIYREIAASKNVTVARLWYFSQIFIILPSFIKNSMYWSKEMLKYYLKIAFRNIKMSKGYSLINIFGLATGMACSILILLWIFNELSYDNFHEKGDSIYRVSIINKKEGKVQYDSPQFVPPMGPAMKKDFPEIKNYARISTRRVAYLDYNGRSVKVGEISYADSTFFDLFSFKLVQGDGRTALVEPFSIVLTKEAAGLLFGAAEPFGAILKINNNMYKVTGIMEDPPANSSISFNALISFSSLYEDPHNYMDWNGGNQYYTYVELHEKTSAADVNEKFPDFMWRYLDKNFADIGLKHEAYLQPLRDIHLFYNDYTGSNVTNIYIFSGIALLILVIACINFINLTTARAGRRAREVGVRKVLGAQRQGLIRQFMSESLLFVVVSFVAAVVLAKLFFPTFHYLVNTELNTSLLFNFPVLAGIFGLMILVGIIAGSYPALYLSSFQPATTIKGSPGKGAGNFKSRNALVVFQFFISLTLIICTIFINQQLRFMKNKELGFNKENILILPLNGESVQDRVGLLKEQLENIPGVVSATAVSQAPYRGLTRNGYFPEGSTTLEMIHVVDVDEDFLKTFEIELVAGRNFSEEITTDKAAYLVNETLAKSLKWDNPLGKIIRRNGEHTIIGVVKDFNFATLHERIEPLIITNMPWLNRFDNVCIKINSENVPATIQSIKSAWTTVSPALPFDYYFLDDSFDNLYKFEQRIQKIFFYFSCIAIIIALLGLFSLASFSVEQRVKEIGIRKVLGASEFQVVYILSRQIIGLVIISAIVAVPIAFFIVRMWLQHYAFRIHISPLVFLLATLGTLVIAFLTVSYQTIRTAQTNPVDALKYE